MERRSLKPLRSRAEAETSQETCQTWTVWCRAGASPQMGAATQLQYAIQEHWAKTRREKLMQLRRLPVTMIKGLTNWCKWGILTPDCKTTSSIKTVTPQLIIRSISRSLMGLKAKRNQVPCKNWTLTMTILRDKVSRLEDWAEAKTSTSLRNQELGRTTWFHQLPMPIFLAVDLPMHNVHQISNLIMQYQP